MKKKLLSLFLLLTLPYPIVLAQNNVFNIDSGTLMMEWTTPTTFRLNETLPVTVMLTASEELREVYISFIVLGTCDKGVVAYSKVYYLTVKPDFSFQAVGTTIENPLIYDFPLTTTMTIDKVTPDRAISSTMNMELPTSLDAGPVYCYVGALWKVNRGAWVFQNWVWRSFYDCFVWSYNGDLDDALASSEATVKALRLQLDIVNKQFSKLEADLNASLEAYDVLLADFADLETAYKTLLGMPVNTTLPLPRGENYTTMIDAMNGLKQLLSEIDFSLLASLESNDYKDAVWLVGAVGVALGAIAGALIVWKVLSREKKARDFN